MKKDWEQKLERVVVSTFPLETLNGAWQKFNEEERRM